jgi:hypothetical protein
MDQDFDQAFDDPFERVPVEATGGEATVPPEFRDRIGVDTVHDGGAIPKAFRCDAAGNPRVDAAALEAAYVRERDWGANLVARHLAAELGLAHYHRIRLARVLLDFNRFPGSTPPDSTDPLQRLAINPPFAAALDHPTKSALLEQVYDRISDQMESALLGKLIKIGIHTYDERNASQTKRPVVSLITRTATYQNESRMSFGVFDPLYPDLLGESTCSRILRDRISLNLERAGFRVGHNHPYLLPEGCVEVRSQVWFFFRYVRRRFEHKHPETREDPAYTMVWKMLLNTNQRLHDSEALRGFLHRYRRVPAALLPAFRAAQRAYSVVAEYVRESTVVTDYRRSPNRPSSLVIEVRKDVLSEFDARGRPGRANEETAASIAREIAGAIRLYLDTDRNALDRGVSAQIPALPDTGQGWM